MPPTTATAAPLPPLALRGWLRYDVVARRLAALGPATSLEIGCGQGSFGARLARQTRYLGVEPDLESFRVADARIGAQGGTVLNGTHEAVPAGSTYDLVCAFEVLEHIEDDRAALAAWEPLIAPGGHLMLSVPAFQERFGPMDTHAGHFRRYSPAEITEKLSAVGLEDITTTVYGWPLGYALESVRNRIDAKKLAAAEGASIEELTAASGRTFQPATPLMGTVARVATWPFRLAQRTRPRAGIGMVVLARKPA